MHRQIFGHIGLECGASCNSSVVSEQYLSKLLGVGRMLTDRLKEICSVDRDDERLPVVASSGSTLSQYSFSKGVP